MDRLIDLHIHTNFSDGQNSPLEILDIVREKRLAAFAVCDHDNYGAVFEINKKLSDDDPEFLAGVELSAGKSGEDIHILGYGFDIDSKTFAAEIERFRENRNRRGAKMLKELKKLGIDIPMQMVRDIAGDSAIGRPHVAEALVKVGAVGHYNRAFSKYIGLDGPAYVPKENLPPRDAIALIHDAGGLAILAHPGISDVCRFIDEFADYGLDGIEIYHPSHDKAMRKSLKKTALRKELLMTGGSDFHGREGHHGKIGSEPVPYEILSLLKDKMKSKNRG
jgi:predicted metal-dependent phosphoesterase TrpH